MQTYKRMYPRMCVYHKISIGINPPSSDNLFVCFGPRKAKYHFILFFLFFFCYSLIVIIRKRISKLFSLKTPKWASLFFSFFQIA